MTVTSFLFPALVMSSASLKTTTTSLLFTVLAIMDTIVLWVGLLRQWLMYAYGVQDIRLLSNATCKLHTFLVYWTSHLASWMLVCITGERFFVVFYPFRAKRLSTKRNALLCLLLLAFVLLLINVQFLWTVRLQSYPDQTFACVEANKYHFFALRILPWIDFSLFSLIPFAVLAVANLSIVGKLLRRNYVRSKRLNKSTCHTKIGNLTFVNFAVSAWFLITTLPISVFLIKQHVWILNGELQTVRSKTLTFFAWAVTANISYLNNSFNFMLYIMTSRRFRAQLIALFKKKHNQESTSIQHL